MNSIYGICLHIGHTPDTHTLDFRNIILLRSFTMSSGWKNPHRAPGAWLLGVGPEQVTESLGGFPTLME